MQPPKKITKKEKELMLHEANTSHATTLADIQLSYYRQVIDENDAYYSTIIEINSYEVIEDEVIEDEPEKCPHGYANSDECPDCRH